MQLPDLRSLYNPLQPTVTPTRNGVVYREFLPALPLQPFIYCYWELKTTQPLTEPFIYRVVADGCMDIFFESASYEAFVMGFCSKYTEFPLSDTFHYVGVRFLPTLFPQLFQVDAASLSNRFEPLAQVVPETARFIKEQLGGLSDMLHFQPRLDAYFLKRLHQTHFNNDSRLYGALECILKSAGSLEIETGLDTGVSPRHLRRLFGFYVGDTAKTFSQIIRFQTLLKATPSLDYLRHEKPFFDAGYYDQAHFIKEFKTLYGLTPTQAFGC